MGVAFGPFPLKFGRLLIHTNINIHFTFQFFKLLVKAFYIFFHHSFATLILLK